jgi:hypothetical protein
MRTILLAGVVALVPFAAFAHGPQQSQANLALTAAGSLAGVHSTQGTSAASNVAGNGFVVNGAVSGNYTDVTTKGAANMGKNAAKTNATATQVNVGGTIAGGYATGNATGNEAGWQNSQALGGSAALGGNIAGSVTGIRAGQD